MPQSGQICGRGKDHANRCRSIESMQAKRDVRRAERTNAENPYRLIRQQVAEYKLSVGCVDCGYNAHPEALEFDHLPGADKITAVSKMYFTSRPDELWAEIAKCELVCANCHRIRTYNRRRNNWILTA